MYVWQNSMAMHNFFILFFIFFIFLSVTDLLEVKHYKQKTKKFFNFFNDTRKKNELRGRLWHQSIVTCSVSIPSPAPPPGPPFSLLVCRRLQVHSSFCLSTRWHSCFRVNNTQSTRLARGSKIHFHQAVQSGKKRFRRFHCLLSDAGGRGFYLPIKPRTLRPMECIVSLQWCVRQSWK